MTKVWKLGLVSAGLLAVLATPLRAEAAPITFTFDCQVMPALDTCIAGGPYGTLTISDNAIDENRVDISWTMTPPWGVNIERVLLNWIGPPNPPLSAVDLYLVDVNAPIGSTTNISPTPTRIICNSATQNCQNQGNTYLFDIRLNEASPQGLTFTASLYMTLGNGATIVNLSPDNFIATSTNSDGATPPLYALFSTIQGPAVPLGHTASSGSEFWGGASGAPISLTQVPEPGSLLLLGSGLLGFAFWRKRANRKA